MDEDQPPIVCDLSVLSETQRGRLQHLVASRLSGAAEIQERPDGYALAFTDASPALLADLAEFIALDRHCCAFLRHALVSDPGPGTTWLELSGGPGAEQAIATELAAFLRS